MTDAELKQHEGYVRARRIVKNTGAAPLPGSRAGLEQRVVARIARRA